MVRLGLGNGEVDPFAFWDKVLVDSEAVGHSRPHKFPRQVQYLASDDSNPMTQLLFDVSTLRNDSLDTRAFRWSRDGLNVDLDHLTRSPLTFGIRVGDVFVPCALDYGDPKASLAISILGELVIVKGGRRCQKWNQIEHRDEFTDGVC